MKINARHMAIDLYKCKTNRFDDMEGLTHELLELLGLAGINSAATAKSQLPDGHIAILVAFNEGHVTINVFPDLCYVASDVFLCQEGANPEWLFSLLRKLFKPEKIKTTQLKRGDFGAIKDMKPKIKTRVAPLRRIQHTGSRVIGLLAKKRKKQEQ